MKQGELIAIGSAYLDINAPNFPLTDSGLQLETEVVGQAYQIEPGGSAVNFARLCSALEIPTTFVGKVGNDEPGRILTGMLAEAQVEPLLITSDDVSTILGFNMISADGKSIMAVVGTASQSLTPDEVYAKVSDRIAGSAYLYLGGCFKLKKLIPAFVHLAADAKAAGTKVVLDHGRLTNIVTADEQEAMRQLALTTDIYLPSADEFRQLWNASSLDEGLRQFSQKAAGTVVVKNSDQGALTVVDGQVVSVPAFSVQPIHTIGAGDSFNAGFIAAQHKGQALLESIKFGCAVAALKISQPNTPTFDEVASFITAQGV